MTIRVRTNLNSDSEPQPILTCQLLSTYLFQLFSISQKQTMGFVQQAFTEQMRALPIT